MSKRASLKDIQTGAEMKDGGGGESKTGPILASVRLPKRTYDLLRSVALSRAAAGARFSLTRVLVDLAEKHRDELEREAKS